MADTRTTLVGRDRHLLELDALLDAVVSRQGHALLLLGEAGAGKTALAEEAARRAESKGVTVGWATCWRSAAAPLSVWTELVETTVPKSTPMPEVPASESDPEGARAMWVRALARHMLDGASSRPTLFVIDDLQWADPLSLHAVDVLSRLLRGKCVGLLCTVRDEGAGSNGRFDRLADPSHHLVVSPLTETELAALAADLTGETMSPGALARLHDRTAGNVLFARELLGQQARGMGLDERQPALSATATIFSERVAELSERCQQVLQAASVIGRRFRIDVLAETLATDVDDLLDLIGEADAAGLMRGPGIGGFEFSHPLVAEACYQAGGLPRRIRMHRDVGEAMERLRARGIAIPAVEIAHHFANATAAGVAPKAADYAAIAGRDDMSQLAYEDAVRDFGLALKARDLCTADDTLRAELLLDLGDAHAASGDRKAAREVYEQAARLGRELDSAHVLARAALGVGSGPGGFEIPPFDSHQIALLEEAATVATGTLHALVLARLSVARALDAAATSTRAALSEQAITLARSTGDPAALGYALASWCDVISGPEAVDDRLTATDEILRCAATAHDIRLELLGRRLRVVALLEAGRIDEFDAEVNAFASSAERLGQRVYSWYVPLWRAMRASMDGHFDTAERLRASAGAIGAAANSENALLLVASQRAMLHCELRDPAISIAFFEEIIDAFPDYAIMTRPALAYALSAAGDPSRAQAVLKTLDPAMFSVDALGSEFLTTVMMTAHAAWLAGDDDHCSVLYDALLPYRNVFAVDGIAGYLVGSVERTLGVLAAQCKDHVLARAHFDAALDAHRKVRSRVLVAGTLRDAGTCLDDADMTEFATREFAALGVGASTPTAERDDSVDRYTFRREGDTWLLVWEGCSAHVRHTKGMADLARLLATPRTEVHVLDLIEAGATVDEGAPGDALDPTARRQYRARLAEIESDLGEADEHADVGRSERLHLERDALVAELSAAYGLGGRARRQGDSSERARSAVTQRIRDAITRIGRVQPELAGHLQRAVRTGTFCAYEPDSPIDWRL